MKTYSSGKVDVFRERGIGATKQVIDWFGAARGGNSGGQQLLQQAAGRALDPRARITASLLLYELGQVKREDPPAAIQRQLIKLLPKIDLHRHLDGSVREEKILEHADRQGIVLANDPGVSHFIPAFPHNPGLEDISYYARPYGKPFSSDDFMNFLLGGFALPLAVMQDRAALEDIAYDAVNEAYKDGLLHVEFRFAPCIHTEKGLTYDEIAEAIIQGFNRGENDFGVSSTLVFCIYRDKVNEEWFGKKYLDHPVKTVESSLRLYRRYPGRIALDIVGYESPYPPQNYLNAVGLSFNSDIPRTIHAGENPGTANNIVTVIDLLKAHRIGHGVHVLELSPEKQEIVKEARVPFEVSVRSNVHLAAMGGEPHPFLRMHQAGFPVVICTDNTTVSDIDLSTQYDEIAAGLGLNLFDGPGVSTDLRTILGNAVSAAFVPQERRVELERDNETYLDLVGFLLGLPGIGQIVKP